MAQITKERKCGPAFSNAEKIRLMECVREASDVIENKQTDKHSQKAKAEAWTTVATQFNQQGTGRICTVQQLQTLYKNSKRETKKHIAEDKVNIGNIYINDVIF